MLRSATACSAVTEKSSAVQCGLKELQRTCLSNVAIVSSLTRLPAQFNAALVILFTLATIVLVHVLRNRQVRLTSRVLTGIVRLVKNPRQHCLQPRRCNVVNGFGQLKLHQQAIDWNGPVRGTVICNAPKGAVS